MKFDWGWAAVATVGALASAVPDAEAKPVTVAKASANPFGITSCEEAEAYVADQVAKGRIGGNPLPCEETSRGTTFSEPSPFVGQLQSFVRIVVPIEDGFTPGLTVDFRETVLIDTVTLSQSSNSKRFDYNECMLSGSSGCSEKHGYQLTADVFGRFANTLDDLVDNIKDKLISFFVKDVANRTEQHAQGDQKRALDPPDFDYFNVPAYNTSFVELEGFNPLANEFSTAFQEAMDRFGTSSFHSINTYEKMLGAIVDEEYEALLPLVDAHLMFEGDRLQNQHDAGVYLAMMPSFLAELGLQDIDLSGLSGITDADLSSLGLSLDGLTLFSLLITIGNDLQLEGYTDPQIASFKGAAFSPSAGEVPLPGGAVIMATGLFALVARARRVRTF
ncbi:hypothetical protein [Parvularcula maris]|uniref:Uncharacterized protein n=1 Tax=Parvularcula maris TaxID=2965077 RepID=A0A9X2RIU7_9PROT|nr:hypothetical protein [Parvularcula maris]MCQ8186434.1 hypothetical protein [Parvularcula maris]